jgi:hypothetical protein
MATMNGILATAKFILTLAIASALTLVFSMIFEPFFAIMKLGAVRDFLIFFFPKGLLIVIFFIAVAKYYLDLQGVEASTHTEIEVRK